MHAGEILQNGNGLAATIWLEQTGIGKSFHAHTGQTVFNWRTFHRKTMTMFNMQDKTGQNTATFHEALFGGDSTQDIE